MKNREQTVLYAANIAALQNKKGYDAVYRRVTDERRKKTDRLRLPKEQRLSLGAEALLLYALKKWQMDPSKVRYGYGENGKPYLLGMEDIRFNLSHSEEAAICAVSPLEVGCDIEKAADGKMETAMRFLNRVEYERIAALQTKQQQIELFFRLWTLKESFVKATGMGMCQPMHSFCISFDQDGRVKNQTFRGQTYYFREIPLWEGYRCAVCGLDDRIREQGVRCEIVDFRYLCGNAATGEDRLDAGHFRMEKQL